MRGMMMVGMVGTVLLLSSCGTLEQVQDVTDAIDAAAEEVAQAQEQDSGSTPDDGGGETEGVNEPSVDVAFDDREFDVTVYQSELEYTLERMRTLDEVDAESRTQDPAVSIAFDLRITNPRAESIQPMAPIALRWEHGQDTYEAHASGILDSVPGNASNAGEMIVTLSSDQWETFDPDAAFLMIGAPGQSISSIALGVDYGTITRLPVDIESLVGEELVLQKEHLNTTITITLAEVNWRRGNGMRPDGEATLAIEYSIVNSGASMSCFEARDWQLLLPDGGTVLADGVSDRCVHAGDSLRDIRASFTVASDYWGDYVLTQAHPYMHWDEPVEVALPFTAEESEGKTAAERAGTAAP
ncbi:hypothetical protein [Microbacterium amylolyticum]|uniref:DUF4352 domain-containing protein n=1 Tax=Microbacterium amylolyticum TaxID=936337 RepID=A0ABS4ZJA9_9MICO|nr:hypothetical protein [Microbacterium amylolyticum]MBP2437361.1 hypothetical protein [Microbacterium amylolyticum]